MLHLGDKYESDIVFIEYAQEQIESWLETLGIRYNIAQNGYICLGKLFGDAIIQWGMSEYTSLQANVDNTIKYPITITEVYCLIPFLKHGWKERAFAGTPFYINDLFNSYFKMAVTKEITANSWFYWVIIGL